MAEEDGNRMTDGTDIFVEDLKALGWTKCPRCRTYHPVKDNHLGLCDKCCHVLIEDFPDDEISIKIKESYSEQRKKHNLE